ncbi:MAG: pyridoxal-dependent decarboxylase [Thermoanaerobaculia bacterium]|nr:pyridoxal-dependent decarboxylase [Thermoanaerobaculia bacterium]
MTRPNEISLDPEDWDAFAEKAHRSLDSALEHLRGAGDRPWRPVPPEARSDLEAPLPRRPGDLDEIMTRVERSLLRYPTGNGHRRFWGWVMGNGTADGMLADMLASAMNPHLGGYDQSASIVERQVVDWWAQVMGFPPNSGGLLVSGATMANLVGVTVARHVKAGFDVRQQGLTAGPPLRIYGSAETHSWAEKSCDVLGLGRDGFRRVEADHQGRLVLASVRAAIDEDRRRGFRPICVCANVGTVDTGAIDDLHAVADFCSEEELWFHVDGAFGALLACSESLKPRIAGLERADSLAFDLHKWGYLPYEVGCVLVRDRELQRSTFRTTADYLNAQGRGILPQPLDFPELGLQLSRGFRALKVWLSLQLHGLDKIGRVIEQNVDQAQYLVRRIAEEDLLELLALAPLNVVCFRYTRPGVDEDGLERLNHEIMLRLQEDGIAIPSSTRRAGRFSLRIAITNHRTRLEDIDVLVESVLDLGSELANSIASDSGSREVVTPV